MAYPAVVLAAASAVTLGAIGPAAAHTGEHTVRSGDTLSRLAADHGTTWRSIHEANLDTIGADPNVLRVGQVLTIGGAGAAAPERASRSDRPVPAPTSEAYAQWDAHVRPAVQEVAEQFGVSTVLTRPGHSPTAGRAADFMVYADAAKGDAVAQYAIDNAGRFGVDYVIWQQRIAGPWTGWTWQAMEDRGSATANHMDHPHVAFAPAG
ncbi:LysM peptidoglycan-binding domain-containing protein [Blastococcus sp. SYSU DS0539]